MGELWRDLVDLLRRRPLLWLPVLVADLLGYLVNLGRNGLLRLLVLHETAQRLALGGVVVHTALTPAELQTASIVALLLSWLTYFFRVLLYSGALVATYALVQGYLNRTEKPANTIAPTLAQYWGGILELSLRGLAVYAVAALLFSSLSPTLAKHGHAALLHNQWFDSGFTLVVLLVMVAMLPPVALRVLAARAPGRALTRGSQQFALMLVLVAWLLAAFVSANSRELAQVSAGARYPLEIVGSLVAALPYVLLFTGLSLLARRLAREERDPPGMVAAA